ncbi:26S protease regulatory subunit 6a [Corchorus olitorius]|uniref:26S protease regulatory subunit 6a n=1 Tax=Corchorus olitorius TaxID=93759 RepID=A0A1R3GLW2_9ROSI|nr:26S protease regulatory subunit 6a [Corchorus olitorius]
MALQCGSTSSVIYALAALPVFGKVSPLPLLGDAGDLIAKEQIGILDRRINKRRES